MKDTVSTVVATIVTNKVRKVLLHNREYLVAPATLIVPGVLAGSNGPLYYPPEEIEKNVDDWNGMPIVLDHPVANGMNVSARDPDILANSQLGTIYRSKYRGKLASEAWFDVELTQRISPAVFNALENNRPIELSTGLFLIQEEHEERVFNTKNNRKKPYKHTARNYRPDHLAVLSSSVGACSVDDGCGINVNSEHPQCEIGEDNLCINCGGEGGTKGPCPSHTDKHHSEIHEASTEALEHTLRASGHGMDDDEKKAKNATRSAIRGSDDGDHLKARDNHETAAKIHEKMAKGSSREDVKEKHRKAAKAHRLAASLHHDRHLETNAQCEVVDNVCVNCGGEGGKKGPCPEGHSKKHRTEAEIKREIREHRREMKEAGIKESSFMNAGHTEQSRRANERLFALKTELEGAKKEGTGTSTHIASFLAKHDITPSSFTAFGPMTKEATVDKYNKEHKTKLSVDEFQRLVGNINQPVTTTNEEEPMDKTTLVNWIITNCECYKGATQEEITALNGMSVERLTKIKAKAEKEATANATPAPVVAVPVANATPQPLSLTEWEAFLARHPEAQATWNVAKRVENEQKVMLVSRLTANVADAEKQAMSQFLMGKGIPELEQMVKLLPPLPTNNNVPGYSATPLLSLMQPIYHGAGGAPPVTTLNQAGLNDVLSAPKIDWHELLKEQGKERQSA